MADDPELAVLTVRFDPMPGSEQPLMGILARYVVVTRQAPACRNIDLLASASLPGRLLLVEKWESVTAAKRTSTPARWPRWRLRRSGTSRRGRKSISTTRSARTTCGSAGRDGTGGSRRATCAAVGRGNLRQRAVGGAGLLAELEQPVPRERRRVPEPVVRGVRRIGEAVLQTEVVPHPIGTGRSPSRPRAGVRVHVPRDPLREREVDVGRRATRSPRRGGRWRAAASA